MTQEATIKETLAEEMHKEEERLFIKKKEPVIQRATLREALKMLIPFAGMAISAIEFVSLPQVHPLPVQYHAVTWLPTLAVCACVYAAFYIVSLFVRPLRKKVAHFAWLIFAFFIFFTVQDFVTLRTGILQLPFIPSPDKIVHELVANREIIASDAVSSMTTLFSGLVIGISMGIISGIACGCVRLVDYWVNPLLKIIGPVPALIWMPLFFVLFHSSRAAALAAVFLASWFPLTLMISSAIKNIDRGLVERAETLGASKMYIVLHAAQRHSRNCERPVHGVVAFVRRDVGHRAARRRLGADVPHPVHARHGQLRRGVRDHRRHDPHIRNPDRHHVRVQELAVALAEGAGALVRN